VDNFLPHEYGLGTAGGGILGPSTRGDVLLPTLHTDALEHRLGDDLSEDCTLRVIFVNDVYELDNLPRLATCVREKSTANTIVMLPGDFLAPSLLSQLDYARGMVDCLNRCGMQYVCFGNHEADIPHPGEVVKILPVLAIT
jgi:2',3'-cyclic-nucleotide 2'-phosphodiesterase (5'-nucleotidase family)